MSEHPTSHLSPTLGIYQIFVNPFFMMCIELARLFRLVWLVTSLLLKNYTKMHQKKTGWWKFWLLATLPLLYYVFSIDLITNNLVTYILENPILRNLIIYVFSATRQVGGFFLRHFSFSWQEA